MTEREFVRAQRARYRHALRHAWYEGRQSLNQLVSLRLWLRVYPRTTAVLICLSGWQVMTCTRRRLHLMRVSWLILEEMLWVFIVKTYVRNLARKFAASPSARP